MEGTMRNIMALACGVAFGCGVTEVDVTQEAIFGGAPDPGHTNVLGVGVTGAGGNYCSGTLISRHVVLTAGHCADPYVMQIDQVSLGPDLAKAPFRAAVDRTIRDPRYSIDDDPRTVHDVAVAHIVDDIPAQPTPLLREKMQNTSEYVGPNYTFVGYGFSITKPYRTGDGHRMVVNMPIQAVGPADVGGIVGSINDSLFYYSNHGMGMCYGDSGGPAFLVRNGVERVAGVASSGTNACTGTGDSARTDQPEIDTFLQAAIDDLEANDPCRADGVCNESCNTDQIVDPDCADQHCGQDGVCALACVSPPDPDCAQLTGGDPDPAAGGCAVAPGSPNIGAWLVLVAMIVARRRAAIRARAREVA